MLKKILGLNGKPDHYLWFYGIIVLVCASNILMPVFMNMVGRWNDKTGHTLLLVENYRNKEKPNILFWGENIPANDGFGWDGKSYANICRDFPGVLVDKHEELFRKKRFVPSMLAWVVIKLTPLEFNNPDNIILAFRIVAFLSLLLSVFIFIKICDALKLSDKTTWLAYIGLFINYMTLKRAMYYPIDTGAVAFLCSLLIIYFYLKKSFVGLLIATILAFFTWELVSLFVLPLFFFRKIDGQQVVTENRGNRFFPGYLIPAFGVVCYLVLYFFYGVIYDVESYVSDTELVRWAVPLSLSIVLLYIFFGTRIVMQQFRVDNIRDIRKNINITGIIFFVVLMLMFKLVLKNMHALSLPLSDVMHGWSLRPIIQPGIFYVAHVVFFGPVIVLVVLLWEDIVAQAREYGLGLLLVMGFAMALSLNSESRHLTMVIVPVIFMTAKVFEHYKITKQECILFCIVSLLYSKVWMLMNIGDVPPDNVLVFPWQRYFMNCGPWISNTMYVVQGVIVVVTTVVLWVWIKRKREFTTENTRNTKKK